MLVESIDVFDAGRFFDDFLIDSFLDSSLLMTILSNNSASVALTFIVVVGLVSKKAIIF